VRGTAPVLALCVLGAAAAARLVAAGGCEAGMAVTLAAAGREGRLERWTLSLRNEGARTVAVTDVLGTCKCLKVTTPAPSSLGPGEAWSGDVELDLDHLEPGIVPAVAVLTDRVAQRTVLARIPGHGP
jgi:hypothetical protein